MQKIIIFDFNRTLYDPEAAALFPDTIALLSYAQSRGHTLYLISKIDKDRNVQITNLALANYFTAVHLVEEKTLELFQKLCAGSTLVIGDRVRHEIKLGNQCGATTIWLCRGKFATELPTTPEEHPTYSITSLHEVYRWLD